MLMCVNIKYITIIMLDLGQLCSHPSCTWETWCGISLHPSLHWYDCYNGYMMKIGIGELIQTPVESLPLPCVWRIGFVRSKGKTGGTIRVRNYWLKFWVATCMCIHTMSCPLGCWGGSTGISIGVRVYTDSASLEPRLTFRVSLGSRLWLS